MGAADPGVLIGVQSAHNRRGDDRAGTAADEGATQSVQPRFPFEKGGHESYAVTAASLGVQPTTAPTSTSKRIMNASNSGEYARTMRR